MGTLTLLIFCFSFWDETEIFTHVDGTSPFFHNSYESAIDELIQWSKKAQVNE